MSSVFRAFTGYRTKTTVFLAIFVFAGLSRPAPAVDVSEYVKSTGCESCHPEIYRQWKMTSHARMLRDAKKNPSAILADKFSDEIPFAKDDIEFVLGSHWIQKYLTKIGGEFYILPKFWNIVDKDWEPYSIWNWRTRPYSRHCNWCHSVGYSTETKTFVEESIGCEACHGPGKKHVESGAAKDIINPMKLPEERADMICESCHTDGKDRHTKTHPFPDGFRPGEDLREYFTDFFMPKPGSKGWYKGEADYLERHRMFLFWQTNFYSTTRSCEVCEFERGSSREVEKRNMSRSEYCGTCHTNYFAEFEAHADHSQNDVECIDCHVPNLDATGRRYSIHDHKFDFSGPELPCAECHGGEVPDTDGEPPHDFKFERVKIEENLTLEQACRRCHAESEGLPAQGAADEIGHQSADGSG